MWRLVKGFARHGRFRHPFQGDRLSSTSSTPAATTSATSATSLAEATQKGPANLTSLTLVSSPDLVCHNLMCEHVGDPCICRLARLLERCPGLEVLALPGNALPALPPVVWALPRLVSLDVSDNMLTPSGLLGAGVGAPGSTPSPVDDVDVPSSSSSASSSTSTSSAVPLRLRDLRLAGNPGFTHIPPEMGQWPALRTVDLRRTPAAEKDLPETCLHWEHWSDPGVHIQR
jgi:hypothetical protein